MTEMTVSETLNRAADLIEERGWTQFEGWANQVPEGAAVCLEGAIQAITGLRRHEFASRPLAECDSYRAVQSYLVTSDDLWVWNDEQATNSEQVIEVLRACAVIEASRERETAEAAS